jgi:xylulokinase
MMKRQFILSIDLGTQGTETALYNDEGILITSIDKDSRLVTKSGGIAEENIDTRYADLLDAISQIMGRNNIPSSDIAAIGLSGQMAGILGIDGNWNAVTPYDSWLDTRCEKYMNLLRSSGEDAFIALTGCAVTYAHGPKILWWKNERPDTYRRIVKFVMMTTYIAGKLAGLKAESAYIDYTQLHFSAFADINTLQWSDVMLSQFDVAAEKMPTICEPWKIIGKLSDSQAKLCGLTGGIPIIAGCGDQAATSFGAGVVRNGHAFDVSGTASLFSCCVDKYRPDVINKTLIFPRAIIPGMWIPQAYINGGGLSLRWYKELLGQDCSKITYELLEREAETIQPGSNDLLFIPHFQGRVCPNDPYIRGGFLGLNWMHKRGHLFRAVLESIGYEYAMYLNILRSLLPEFEIRQVAVTGGGAKSQLFNKIKADILGVPYVCMERGDAPILGTAVLAGYGVGIYQDLVSAIESLSRKTIKVVPSDTEKRQYEKYCLIYKEMINKINSIYKILLK